MNYQELSFLLNGLSKISYPELTNVDPDYSFGRMVYDSYAGAKSELTAILMYTYESLTNTDKEDVVMLIEGIAKQEMKHLELLGEVLVSLGMEPYYMGTYGKSWSSDNVKTKFVSFSQMIDYNIKSEEEAISEYKHLINVCTNESIKNLIARIIMDEENHIQIFELIKKQYCN